MERTDFHATRAERADFGAGIFRIYPFDFVAEDATHEGFAVGVCPSVPSCQVATA